LATVSDHDDDRLEVVDPVLADPGDSRDG